MTELPDSTHAGLSALYERLIQAFACGARDGGAYVAGIKEAIGRAQALLDAPLREGGFLLELRRRFALATWLPRIAQACEDADIRDEANRSSLTRTIGERLLKIHTLIDLMNEEEDFPDLRDHLVFAYVEAKSEWQQLNGIINYSIARGQMQSPETVARAVLISAIVAELDSLFGQENIDVLTDYLYAPLPNAHELTLTRHSFPAAA